MKMSHPVVKKQSIQSMLMRPMIIVQVIIIAIFIATIHSYNIIGKLRQGEVANLARTVAFRGNMVEEKLLNLGAIAVDMAEHIQAGVKQTLGGSDTLAPDRYDDILTLGMPVLADALKLNAGTGAYLVLDGGVQRPEQSGIGREHAAALYLLDEDIATVGSGGYDLMMLIGPKALARDPVIPLDNYWAYDMPMDMFNSLDFMGKPFQAAQANPALSTQRLCYWSKPVQMNGNREAIMVTVPLRLGEKVFGVVGMELSLERLKAILRTDELHANESSFYAMADATASTPVEGIFTTAGSFAVRHLNTQRQDSQVKPQRDYGENIVELNLGDKTIATAMIHPFNIYYQDSPFKDEGWVLMGGVENSVIFRSTENLTTILIIAFGASIGVALLFSYLMTLYLERPIRRLSAQLMTVDLDEERPISLEVTHVEEIDMLIHSIETLSSALSESGKRTLTAIELTDMPIGFIEINHVKQQVFMTDLSFSLLNLRHEKDSHTIPIAQWNEIYQCLLRHPEGERHEHIYHLQTPETTQERYLKLRCAQSQGRTFAILMDVTEDLLERKQLEHERDTDPLTGLYNRKAFMTLSKKWIQQRPDKVGIMLFADLDNLKFVNDTYGHDVGDRYIRATANTFAALKEKGTIVSRISGDEFAMFLYGYNDQEELQAVLSEYYNRFELATICLPDNQLFKLRFSMGYAWYPQDATEIETLLRYADFAMYEIKRSSKGSIKAFSLQSYMENAFLIEKNEAFNQFVEQNLVRYAFQPIVDVFSGAIFGYEALMRPDTPEFESPYHLLRIAQSQAKLYQIERMTFFNLFKWMADHQDDIKGMRIFINSIPDQLLSPKDFGLLEAQFGALFRQMVLEVTENQQTSPKIMHEKLGSVRRLGASVAVDDFGTGYSNELVVLNANPDFIKVDLSLVQGIHANENKQHMFETVVQYAKQAGIKLIAEGVESVDELECVIRLGVDYVQGYYLARPEFGLLRVDEAVAQQVRMFSMRYNDRRKRVRRA